MAGRDLAGAGRREMEPLGALARHLERNLLHIEQDFGDILPRTAQVAELVQHALNSNRGDGGTLQRRQQHAAQRIGECQAKATLQRFGDKGGLALIACGGLLFKAWRLLHFPPILDVGRWREQSSPAPVAAASGSHARRPPYHSRSHGCVNDRGIRLPTILLGPLHPPAPPLYRAPHHSCSEQVAPSRSAFNALIGWGFIGR